MKPYFFSLLFVLSLLLASFVRAGDAIAGQTLPQLRTDSTDLFNEITDISRQIEQRTAKEEQDWQAERDDLSLPGREDSLTAASADSLLIPHRLSYRNRLDSLYRRSERGTLMLPVHSNLAASLNGLTFRDTLFYNPLFLPMIFTGKILPREISFYSPDKEQKEGLLLPREKTFAPALEHADFIQHVRRNYYRRYPDRIRYSVASFDTIPRIENGDAIVRETFNPFRELIRTETTYSLDAPGVEGIKIARKYWVYNGEHSFQFAQNYFSTNWHKGGTNNLNFNSYQVIRGNYQKDKVRFNNTLEWRLSLFNAPDDTIRSYRIGNDQIRYYGDFGLTSFVKGWSYSMNMEAKSQLFNNYPSNSTQILSSFLAPLYVNAGVGLKFDLNKNSEKVRHRNLKWTLNLAPISINYKYVGNDEVNVKRYGIPEDRKSLLDIGSTITSILKYNFTRYVSWDSRLTYFTSYEKVVSEFENSLNMALSNAFSTRIYVNLRFDDGVPADPDLKYWQVNQTLSFGLNYKW